MSEKVFPKTAEEISNIVKGQKIVDDVYDYVLASIIVGISEIELRDLIEKKMMELGAEKTSFPTIVAFGSNAAEPHHEPSDRKLNNGEFVLIDMGVVVGGMCSDFTRTFAFGCVAKEDKKIYNIVRRAQALGIKMCRPNMQASALDKIVRDAIIKSGYGEYFIHSTGHGVGAEIHECPFIKKDSGDFLLKDMVVTIEPGIYIEGKVGVRIEDMITVGTNKRISRHKTKVITIKR